MPGAPPRRAEAPQLPMGTWPPRRKPSLLRTCAKPDQKKKLFKPEVKVITNFRVEIWPIAARPAASGPAVAPGSSAGVVGLAGVPAGDADKRRRTATKIRT